MNVPFAVKDTVLHTPRLTLRGWQGSDAQDLYAYASVSGVGEMAGWSAHTSLEESRRIVDMFRREDNCFAIVYKGRVVGSLGIEKYDENSLPELAEQKGREIGFVLAKEHWGKGLMPEAVQEVIRFLFEEQGLDVITCGYFLGNSQSARVQEKCGFRFVKQIRRMTRTGEVKEAAMNLLTREAWLQNR